MLGIMEKIYKDTAKIFGKIVIGNNTVIAANSVVNKDFIEGNCTIGGVPAKIIGYRDKK